MIIYNTRNRKSEFYTREEISFNDFAERLNNPYVSDETYDEYMKYPKQKQDELKDVGGYVGGALKNNKRSKKTTLNRSLIVLDADHIGSHEKLENIHLRLEQLDFQYVMHSTRKSTHESPRVRIIFPLARPIPVEMYEPIVRSLCFKLGMEVFDRTCTEYSRMMYYPSCSSDIYPDDYEFYRSKLDALSINGKEFLEKNYLNWNNISEWPEFPNETEIIRRSIKELGDPREKKGPIGTFCRAYSISEVIETYLSDKYVPGDSPDRYTYANGTSVNGLRVFDDLHAYSHHDTDPTCTEHAYNAYDLVRVHRFGDTDKSYDSMMELMLGDEKYNEQKKTDALEKFNDVELTDEEKGNVKTLAVALETTKNGKNKTTIDNFYQILTLDPRLYNTFYFDVFANKRIVHKPLPWHNTEDILPRLWNDSDDSNLRHFIEKEYQIKNASALADAENKAFYERMIHPVREYLNSLEWDGVKRVDTLLIDYFGAEDNVYTREAISKILLAAVARVYHPGTKFDCVLILKGKQGTGKSTFVRILASDEWFSDSLTRFEGKEAFELLENKWIIELGELKGLYRKEVDQAKQFFSKTSDQYRSAYARHPEEHPRQCVFIGTTNNETFLNDRTGNRRFWPIGLGKGRAIKNVFEDLKNERDQIWAEIKDWYDRLIKADPSRRLLGETLILSGEAEKLAEIERESRMEDDPRYGEIIEFIKRRIPKDWNKYDIDQRNNYWKNHKNDDDETVYRKRISAREIICELYGADNRNVTEDAKEINSLLDTIDGLERIKKRQRIGIAYGIQTCYKVKQEFFDKFSESD